MKHPSGAAEDKRQENPPEYYHSVRGDSDGLCRKRFLTIDSPQHSFAKQMQGEPEQWYLHIVKNPPLLVGTRWCSPLGSTPDAFRPCLVQSKTSYEIGLPTVFVMVGTISAVAFIIKLPVMPGIVVAVIVAAKVPRHATMNVSNFILLSIKSLLTHFWSKNQSPFPVGIQLIPPLW